MITDFNELADFNEDSLHNISYKSLSLLCCAINCDEMLLSNAFVRVIHYGYDAIQTPHIFPNLLSRIQT
jgi:hypothetical protein